MLTCLGLFAWKATVLRYSQHGINYEAKVLIKVKALRQIMLLVLLIEKIFMPYLLEGHNGIVVKWLGPTKILPQLGLK